MFSSNNFIFEIQNKFTSDSILSSYENHAHRALFQINKKLHLAISVTQKKMKEICQKKNVDSVTVLFSQYLEFMNVFSKKKADILFSHQICNLAIQLKEEFQLSFVFLYSMSHDEIQKLCYYLDKNLIKKFIQVSHFHVIFSVLFAKKSEEKLCFCVNYKKLNAITVKNCYLLFLILEILNYLYKTRIYFKLDIIHTFNHLCI